MINKQLATIRAYDRAEVAQILNIKDTWLRRWVTARCIPHQRSGNPDGAQQRGVWFTWADILAIGEMLPGLMTPRQVKQAAAVGVPSAAPDAPAVLPADVLDRWASIGLR